MQMEIKESVEDADLHDIQRQEWMKTIVSVNFFGGSLKRSQNREGVKRWRGKTDSRRWHAALPSHTYRSAVAFCVQAFVSKDI